MTAPPVVYPPTPTKLATVGAHPEWVAFALSLVVVVCVTVLVATGKSVPSILSDTLFIALGVGGGVMKGAS